MIPTFFVLVGLGAFGAYKYISLWSENSRLKNENTRLKEQLLDYKLTDNKGNNALGF